ncbi:hypothetical protein RJ640_008702 [Escallonia rubra]|uniref:Pectate lyase superfamily protein domain-containing protein n=1 Tax=Escallonia rubra TaxID=112253 RepID=A0AA88RAU2_9ASTE|nr:hypothetical protein RJ640_008702 [Escallonia rubra]
MRKSHACITCEYWSTMEVQNSFSSLVLGSFARPSWTSLLLVFTVLIIFTLQFSGNPIWPAPGRGEGTAFWDTGGPPSCAGFFRDVPVRKVVMSIEDFGGVGDGETSNTAAFWRAIRYMESFGQRGGSQLNVPRGRWLTGSFNLTSNFTLFLQEGAVILGSQDDGSSYNRRFYKGFANNWG